MIPIRKDVFIKALRARNWSIADVARLVGTTRQNLSQQIKKSRMKPSWLCEICSVLIIEVNEVKDILTAKEPRKTPGQLRKENKELKERLNALNNKLEKIEKTLKDAQ